MAGAGVVVWCGGVVVGSWSAGIGPFTTTPIKPVRTDRGGGSASGVGSGTDCECVVCLCAAMNGFGWDLVG